MKRAATCDPGRAGERGRAKRRLLWRLQLWTAMRCAIAAMFATLLNPMASSAAQGGVHSVYDARIIHPRVSEVATPAGLSYSPHSGFFYVLDAIVTRGSTTIGAVTAFQDTLSDWTVPLGLSDVRNTAFLGGRLLLHDAGAQVLFAIDERAGELDVGTLRRLTLPPLGPFRAEGLAADPVEGALFMLDRLTRRIVHFVPGDASGRSAAAVSWIPLDDLRAENLRGLAFHPGSRRLYIMSPETQTLYERDEYGRPIGAFDLEPAGIVDPQAMVFAPSGDRTDEASALSLYIVDAQERGGEPHGHVVEIAFAQVEGETPLTTSAAPILALAQTIDMSRFDPPSTDPSGVAYDPNTRRLWIVDGEVEETERWDGVNFFEVDLEGAFKRGANLKSLTTEPVGAAWDPERRELFIADDDARKVFVIDPSSDGKIGTSDDRESAFRTTDFDSHDPEGITYDPDGRRLFIADGVNSEIYVIEPGSDGEFDGEDEVSHFDTERIGVIDPETVEYSTASGTLFLIAGEKRIVEITVTGSKIREFDIAHARIYKPAGLALAPGSGGARTMSFYIVDRGLDNDSHPEENDGKIFELATDIPVTGPANTEIEIRVAAKSDDAEEKSGGSVSTSSSDLDLVTDGSPQTVGLRFRGVTIPRGAKISKAYVQFMADEKQSGTTNLTIEGHDTDDAPAFSSSSRNISSRPRTQATTSWSPLKWTSTGRKGEAERTSDLSQVIQEIVSRPGWQSGNALALIITGSGRRTAESYDGKKSGAPLLHIELSNGPPNLAPQVDAGPDQTIELPAAASLDGTVSDDGALDDVTVRWTKVSGPGTVSFANDGDADTEASFSASGTYALRLTADDGVLASNDELTIEVRDRPAPAGTIIERRIAHSQYDVEERPGGKMSFSSSDLELVDDGGVQTIGLRFTNLPLARGARIARAFVQFTTDEKKTGSTQVTIRGHATDHAAVFANVNHNVSSRATTSVSVPWSPPAWSTIGEADAAQRTPDLSGILEEILGRPGWQSGNAIVLILSGQGQRTAESYDGQRDAAPLLHIELESAEPIPESVERAITASSDDAEESLGGSMLLTSGDLDLTEGGSIHTIGLRFTELEIPRGAVITSAHLQFQADETGSVPTNLIVQAHAHDDAPTFTTALASVSSRELTGAAVAWSPPTWAMGAAGDAQRSPDLKTIVQAIVSRPGWQSGQALAFVITGRGHRSAESFEGNAGGAPVLRVEFETQ